MWDWIKDSAAKVITEGAAYLNHYSFIEGLLQMTYEQAYGALRERMFELDDKGYAAFCNTLNLLAMNAQQQLQAAHNQPHGESWGASVEDQMAQFMAETQAGVNRGPNPAVQQAEYRLQNLNAVAQYAEQFRTEALAAASTPRVAPDPAPAPLDTDEPSISDRVEAFRRHAERIMGDFGGGDAGSGAPAPSDDEAPLDEMAALRLYLDADRRLASAMMRLMPGAADESVIVDLSEIQHCFGRVRAAEPSPNGFYSEADLLKKVGTCLDYSGMARESMRQDAEARAHYEQALAYYEAAGSDDEAARCRRKIAELDIAASGDTDAEMERLQSAVLERSEASLERVDALISLGEALARTGDGFDARDHFHDAEDVLRELGHENPAPDALAQSLLSSMQAIMDGTSQAGGTDIERRMNVRSLYTRLYHGLASAYRDDDVDRADEYLRKAETMDDTRSSQDFGKQVMDMLSGQYKDLLK